jgi:hypothetical protein
MAYAVSGDDRRWPDGVVPYEISDDFSSSQVRDITRAIRHWNDRTIMRLVRHSDQEDFVRFAPADGFCQSQLGRQGGMQEIGCDIGDGFSTGNVIHEIGHAVGYNHEHQRPDRDQFITINAGNIEQGREDQFDIRLGGVILGPYDYGSIMHYSRTAFADGGNTIVTPPGVSIGQRDGLSTRDILGVCVLYGAPHFTVAFEDDQDRRGHSTVMWAGLARWGKYCWKPVEIDDSASRRSEPAVAIDADRSSVIVWRSGRSGSAIRAECRTVDGAERFGQITVASGGGTHRVPDIAIAANGDFVVVWQTAITGGGQEIRARGFTRSGGERFAPIVVAAGDTDRVPGSAAVAMDGSGSFTVVWGELAGESLSVRARRYTPDGQKLFEPLTVAESLGDQDVFPRVASASNGRFVVAWERGSRDVRIRGFNGDTSDLFAETAITGTDVGAQLRADAAMHPAGHLLAAWTDDRNENRIGQVRAQRVALDGSLLGDGFAGNPRGGGEQQHPRVAIDASGHVYLVWEDDEDGNDIFQIHATVFDAFGARSLRSLTVNTRWRGQQRSPAVATR